MHGAGAAHVYGELAREIRVGVAWCRATGVSLCVYMYVYTCLPQVTMSYIDLTQGVEARRDQLVRAPSYHDYNRHSRESPSSVIPHAVASRRHTPSNHQRWRAKGQQLHRQDSGPFLSAYPTQNHPLIPPLSTEGCVRLSLYLRAVRHRERGSGGTPVAIAVAA